MKHSRLLFGLLLLCFLGRLEAQSETQPLTLKASYEYAVQNSPRVQTNLLEEAKNDWVVKEVLSSGLPQVNLSGQYIYNLKLATQLIPNFFGGNTDELIPVQFGTKMNTQLSGEVNQLLFSKTFFLGLDAARTSRELYELQTALTKDELAYQIAQLYYTILITQKQSNILQANLSQVRNLIAITEKQFNNGLVKKIDLDQLQVNQINLETQLQNLNLEVERWKQMLKFAMAMPLDQPIALTDTLNEALYTIPDLEILKPDFSQKKELAILDVQSKLGEMNVEQYRAGYWPSLYAFGNYNFQAQGDRFSELKWFDFGSIGLSLNVPIFDGNRKKTKIEQANIGQLQLAQTRRLTEQSLVLAYNQSTRQLNANINNLKALSQNRRLAEEVYRVAQSRYREGIASVVEVLTAETSMREAQTNYLSALLQVKLAEIEILNAKGILSNSVLNN
jgi:outer membrane protein TolC